MTISSQTRTAGPFTGTGAVISCPFSFKVFQASELVVLRTNTSGVQSTLALGADYTVTLNADQNVAPGGVVTLLAALPIGYTLLLTSAIALLQTASLLNGGAFNAKVIEDALDRLVIMIQQQGYVGLPQTLRAPEVGGLPLLPLAASRANRILAFDGAGNPVAIVGADSGSAAATLALDLLTGTASKGSYLVNHLPSYFGGIARLLGIKLNDWCTFGDVGAVGDGVTDDTAAMQRGIDAMALLGGGVVTGVPGKTYLISGFLTLKLGVKIDLMTAMVLQIASNTPIFKAPSTGDIQSWAVRNGRLRFNTQQTSAQTSAVGIQLADGHLSYDFAVEDIRVENACDGIMCPGTTGSFAFVGRFTNVIANQCARWALNIDCDSASGANTNLSFVNCWALQSGTPISTSRGFRFNALSMGSFDSLFADRIQGTLIDATSCDGRWGQLTLEAATVVANSVQTSLLLFSECSGTIETLKLVSNTLTATGTGEIYMVRGTTTGANAMTINNLVTQTNTYSGGAAIYEINPTAGMTVRVRRVRLDRTENLVDPNAYAPRIVEWNGYPRVARGTTAQRPTLPASVRGYDYLDTSLNANGKPIKWTGAAWVDSTGATV